MNEDVIPLLLAAALIAGAVAAVIVALRRERHLRAALAERERLLARITDRFADVPELVAFAASPEAERLFQIADGRTAIAGRLLSLAAASFVLLAIGIAFLINSFAPLPSPDINYVREALEARWWAIMFLALGIGVGTASLICTRLARRWGLLPG